MNRFQHRDYLIERVIQLKITDCKLEEHSIKSVRESDGEMFNEYMIYITLIEEGVLKHPVVFDIQFYLDFDSKHIYGYIKLQSNRKSKIENLDGINTFKLIIGELLKNDNFRHQIIEKINFKILKIYFFDFFTEREKLMCALKQN